VLFVGVGDVELLFVLEVALVGWVALPAAGVGGAGCVALDDGVVAFVGGLG